MRRFLAVGFVLALLPAIAPAQEQGWAAKFFQGGLTHDFGNVAWGSQLTHKFTVTNIYNVPFTIEEARVSCGCVTPKKPTGVIPPRGTAELEANMDTRKVLVTGQPKVVNVFVKLTSVPQNPGDKVFTSTCTLTVSCIAKADLRFSQDKIVFGVVSPGQTPKQMLDVEHFTNPAFEITGVAQHNYPVDVTVDKTQPRLGGRSAYLVTATLKGNAPAGELKYEVQLTTNDKATPVITVVMEGIIQAPLVAAPNSVNLGNVKVGEVVSGRVILRGPAGQNFKITKVDGTGDGVTLKLPEKAGPVHLLMIEFVPVKPGKVAKTLTLKTDLPGDLTATVLVEGTGIAP